MARDGMAVIISELRRITNTAEGDTIVNGVAYWTDDQLQDVLDQNGKDVLDVVLTPMSMMESGTLVYRRYYLPEKQLEWYEGTESAGAFTVVDAQGNTVDPSLYTLNRARRLIEFTSTTGGTTYYLRARVYDVTLAASQVWFEKAGHRAALIEWKLGLSQLKEDQEYQHCLDMSKHYASKHGFKSIPMRRAGYA